MSVISALKLLWELKKVKITCSKGFISQKEAGT